MSSPTAKPVLLDPPMCPEICFVHSIDFSQLPGRNLGTPDLEKVGGNCFDSVLLEKGQGLLQGSVGLDWDRTRVWERQNTGGSWRHWGQTGELTAVGAVPWLGLTISDISRALLSDISCRGVAGIQSHVLDEEPPHFSPSAHSRSPSTKTRTSSAVTTSATTTAPISTPT